MPQIGAARFEALKKLNTLSKASSLLSPHERKRGLLILILVMGMAFLETLGVVSVMPFLAVLGDPSLLNSDPVLVMAVTLAQSIGINTPDHFLIALGISSFLLIVITAAYRTITHYAMNRFIEMRRHSIGKRLFEVYLRHPYAFFLEKHSGDLSKTILSEVDQFIGNVLRPTYNMAASGLVLISITTLLLIINPWIALLTAGLVGGLYALVFVSLKDRIARLGGMRETANKERFVAASETLGGIKEIKLLGQEQSYLRRFVAPSKKYAGTLASHQTVKQVPSFLIEAIIFGAMLLLTIVLMITAGGLSGSVLGQILPLLGVYAFAAYRIKPAVHNIYAGLAGLRYGQSAVDSLYADLCADSSLEHLPKTAPKPLKAEQSISLQNLFYKYPQATRPSLLGLDLTIPVGSAVGLVGSTGAGKTTLVDIILGLLRPTEGAIAVDGIPISDLQLRAWQQSLGYVPQEIFLTDSTLAENIALGVPPEKIDHDQVIRCARLAQMHDFIMRELPEQYATLVGERGVRLSGGQRQRIGIARALYHDPEVLVFDEATSALDNTTEKAVMHAIDTLTGKKTIILIAHRVSTVRNCDQVVLLERGKIKVTGTYLEVIKNHA